MRTESFILLRNRPTFTAQVLGSPSNATHQEGSPPEGHPAAMGDVTAKHGPTEAAPALRRPQSAAPQGGEVLHQVLLSS